MAKTRGRWIGPWGPGLMAVAIALFVSCSSTDGEEDAREGNGRLRVVATTIIIADVARAIGGSRVEVVSLMGPGVDPHLYKASAGDVKRLASADVILYNGLHLEAKMADVLERMRGKFRTVAVAEAVDPANLLSPEGYNGAHDPHIWFDVTLYMRAAEAIRDAFIEADPANEEVHRENAFAYLLEMQALHEYVHSRAEELAPERRVLVTAHDAFNYFGRAYGFTVRGLQGISTESKAGTADVRELAEFIVERRIHAIFVESSVPPQAIEAVQAAVRDRGFDVGIGGELYSDALGDPGTPAGTYLGMVRANVDTIVDSLLGKQEDTDGDPRGD